ncbi:MAG: cupin domain-containing protein [Candidatus Aenigmatarchaeota archaeon]
MTGSNSFTELDFSQSIVHETEGVRYIPIVEETELSVSYVFLESEKFVPYHSHEKTKHVYHFSRGMGEIILDGERFKIEAPSVIPIPEGVAHRVKNIGSEMLEFLVIEIPSDDEDYIEEKIKI